MQPEEDPLRVRVAQPVRLDAARQGDALGGYAVVVAEAEVGCGRRDARVRLLVEVEVPQLGAHHGEDDVLEVVVCAMLALERRRAEPGRCGRHLRQCQCCSAECGRGNGLALRVVEAMPTLLPKEMVFGRVWSAMLLKEKVLGRVGAAVLKEMVFG